MAEINDFLKELRGRMSLREAAQRSGLSHSYIAALEQNKRPGSNGPISPSPDSLKRLAEAYRYPYEELMRKAGYIESENKDESEKDVVDKFIEYLELDLSDDEIIERMTFKVDGMELDDEDVREWIAFVRAKRFMKTQRPGSSNTDGH